MALSKSFLSAATKAMFNSNEWAPVGDPVNLKSIWAEACPGLYESIDGDTAPVIGHTFSDGSVAYSIAVPLKGRNAPVELRLSPKCDLTEGDFVKVQSIVGQELSKAGQSNIVRYSADLA